MTQVSSEGGGQERGSEARVMVAAAGRNTSGGDAGGAVQQAVKRKQLQPIGEDQTDCWIGEPLTGSRNGSW